MLYKLFQLFVQRGEIRMKEGDECRSEGGRENEEFNQINLLFIC
jgi:hypothetical protein